jgi:hypothetical protein
MATGRTALFGPFVMFSDIVFGDCRPYALQRLYKVGKTQWWLLQFITLDLCPVFLNSCGISRRTGCPFDDGRVWVGLDRFEMCGREDFSDGLHKSIAHNDGNIRARVARKQDLGKKSSRYGNHRLTLQTVLLTCGNPLV